MVANFRTPSQTVSTVRRSAAVEPAHRSRPCETGKGSATACQWPPRPGDDKAGLTDSRLLWPPRVERSRLTPRALIG